MTLTLYNTLTRRKEPFQPIDPKNVRMYVCGPTVYDLAHIGNARPIIVFDVLFRLLRHLYGEAHVTYARNITDVDDKINARAVERYPELPPTEAIRKLTEETTAQFHKDIAGLGVLEPTVEPRATEHIAEMRALCDALVANGHAYVAEDHVLFSVSSMPDYGRLARRSLEEMEAGARVDVAPYKKGPMDFVLWKPSKPGEPAWPSPAGIATPGRPGWHIECSAMADRWLWEEPRVRGLLSEAGLKQPHVFDIHGGGIDLVFPHHENEVAQSRCAHGTRVMANVWMHNGFLQVEGEKMSKSLGNFVTINELLSGWRGQRWHGEALRLAMLRTHYRQPIDFTEESLREATRTLDYLYRKLGETRLEPWAKPEYRFQDALLNDLNTPEAVHWIINEATYANPDSGDGFPNQELKASANLLGLLNSTASEWAAWHSRAGNIDVKHAEDLIAARLAARKAKNWAEGDRIRDELAAMGIQLKDGKDPATGEPVTTWEVKR
ncbi:cysteine--tRNA ligase [Hyphomicrobium sp. CS1BSMeth3]|uniref:cysteine--tRNA ligase n=1 Tax=Hyphomicrobium sp. CS1BSMeth3 TaxID=1892844 RepID=UPI0009300429|nr:cysteine--tRNA ligase [Hyphomicrobium sp. CS1BSMeth3]